MTSDEQDKSSQVDWEERYRSTNGDYFFGKEPSALARLAVHFWHICNGQRPAHVLDLGCGEGRDAVYFAQQGWRVAAVDCSPTAIERVKQLADEAHVRLEAVVCGDMRHCVAEPEQHGLRPPSEYDLVFAGCSIGGLGDEALRFLDKLRTLAPIGALHAIRSATREAWGLEQRPGFYRFDRNELKLEYRRWRLLYYAEDLLYVPHMDRLASFADVIAQKLEP